MLNGKRILVTGGTGSFGQRFTRTVLSLYPSIREIIIFSRDAGKQAAMAQQFGDSRLKFIAGNIALPADVEKACRDIDVIVHTAAMRIVPEAEAHPIDCIRTNISGAENLLNCAVKFHIPQILALSTDMASSPHNVYGATKMLSDKLFIAAYHDHPELKTSVIRYGNMLASTGTVIPFFIRKAKEDGILPVTDSRMTRFMASLDECVHIALRALEKSIGGETFAPKLKSYNIMTIAEAVAPQCETRIVGLRPGEKLFEKMVSATEACYTIETKDSYIIVPPYGDKATYCRHHQAKPVPPDFEFNSENNPDKFTPQEIRQLIGKPDF